MSINYNSPLFGQGDGPDNFEVIPILTDATADNYNILLPLDTGGSGTDPSAFRWIWRVRRWTFTANFTTGPDSYSWTFNLTDFEDVDEADLTFPGTNGTSTAKGLRSRRWRITATDTGVTSGPILNITGQLGIGSFQITTPGGGIFEPEPPTANDLFWERSTGLFTPRVTAMFQWTDPDGNGFEAYADSRGIGASCDMTIDGVVVPDCTMNAAGITFSCDITPDLFWSWSGRYNTSTGARLFIP